MFVNMCYNRKNMQAFFRNSLEIPAFVFKILPVEYRHENNTGLYMLWKGAAE